jgi:hypothetical protein
MPPPLPRLCHLLAPVAICSDLTPASPCLSHLIRTAFGGHHIILFFFSPPSHTPCLSHKHLSTSPPSPPSPLDGSNDASTMLTLSCTGRLSRCTPARVCSSAAAGSALPHVVRVERRRTKMFTLSPPRVLHDPYQARSGPVGYLPASFNSEARATRGTSKFQCSLTTFNINIHNKPQGYLCTRP